MKKNGEQSFTLKFFHYLCAWNFHRNKSMSAKRYYYQDTITHFLQREENWIIGDLTRASVHDVNEETTTAWLQEINILQAILAPYSGRGSIFFEYNIPRMGRRVDVALLIDGVVFVLEFKVGSHEFIRDGLIQVWDYAIDLKNFQEGSLEKFMIPILVCTNAKDKDCNFTLKQRETDPDNVFNPLRSNSKRLAECIDYVLLELKSKLLFQINDLDYYLSDDLLWARSGYSPTPTIIEAATALYHNHSVEDITKHGGDIDKTAVAIDKIINKCELHHRKAIIFVTGVPGAGKTLIGLNTAIQEFERGKKAVYLSGNYPLVEVLQEALARDYVKRAKENGGKVTKPEAKSKVKAFIQMIHHYRDLYLEGTKVENGEIVPIEGYFQGHKDKAYVPAENVAIFDEAQRAWTKEQLVKFMNDKKGIKNFPYSEPEYLISCMDRQQDWGVVICLVGGGQEINKGEAGMVEWINALNKSFKHWDVYMSDQLKDNEYANGQALNLINKKDRLYTESDLHLSVSMRSFKAEKVSTFVHQLLDLQQSEAAKTLKDLNRYPIILTRSLDKAKAWLKKNARASERFGILASSKAERLKAISINVRYQPDFVHWFLDDDTDIRSSNCLEDTLTEFKVQGLEIDWSCVVWDADMRLDNKYSQWQHYALRGGAKWNHINKSIDQLYQINAYRVLLTRARQGMIIVVPDGDNGFPPDDTRKPEFYDNTYNYLKGIGIPEI